METVHNFQLSASQISTTMKWKGPSIQVDSACASSFTAFVQAFVSMQNNLCDQAIVTGVQINLKPTTSCGFQHLGMLAKDGRSKCLDEKADGYCRAEGAVSIFLQKESQSKRIWAYILSAISNCDGYKKEGFTFPCASSQNILIKEAVKKAKVNPLDIDYVEAHITGTQAGDPVECSALLDALRGESTKPLLFGALKSNMGHSEGASALCGLSKAVKIFQTRQIPANLNYTSPNPAIKGLKEGRVVPVLKTTPFKGSYISLNSFGLGGVNVHAILEINKKVGDWG